MPAFHSRGTDATTAFIRGQAVQDALIVSICDRNDAIIVAITRFLNLASATWQCLLTFSIPRTFNWPSPSVVLTQPKISSIRLRQRRLIA